VGIEWVKGASDMQEYSLWCGWNW